MKVLFGAESAIGRILAILHSGANRSISRKIAYASVIAASAASAAKLVSFLKEVIVAASFGLSNELEIYLMAFVVIGLPANILINAVQTALIPELVRAETSGDSGQSTRLLSRVSGMMLVLLGLFLIPWVYCLFWLIDIIASGFSTQSRHEIIQAVYWLIPYYILNGLNLIGYGALQARRRFAENGLLPIIVPLATIVVLKLSAGTAGWETLVLALTLGTFLEFALVQYAVMRQGESLFPLLTRMNGDVVTLLRSAVMLVPGTIILAFGPVIDQAIAASLGEGSVATLAYGYRLPSAFSGIMVTAIGITALPFFAKMVQSGELSEGAANLRKIARWLASAGTAVALVLALLSTPLIELFYQRGAFTEVATASVTPVQQAYFLQLPAALVAIFSVRILIALGCIGYVSVITAIQVLLQASLGWLLSLRFGVSGIAFASAMASAVTAIWTYLTAERILRHRNASKIVDHEKSLSL